MERIYNSFAFTVCLSGLIKTCSLPLPPSMAKGGQFQYLTNVSILITTVYYFLQTIFSNHPFMYFHRLCHNVQFTVTIAYWTLYWGFPHLLNSEFDVDKMLDLQTHFFPYVFLSISKYIWKSQSIQLDYRKSIVYWIIILYMSGYWGYIEMIYIGENIFPYPFLSGQNALQRLKWLAMFLSGSCIHEFFSLSR